MKTALFPLEQMTIKIWRCCVVVVVDVVLLRLYIGQIGFQICHLVTSLRLNFQIRSKLNVLTETKIVSDLFEN